MTRPGYGGSDDSQYDWLLDLPCYLIIITLIILTLFL